MMNTRAVPAADLHLGDLVLLTRTARSGGSPCTGPQGSPPVVVLCHAGKPGYQAVPADQPLTVLTKQSPPQR